MSVTTCAKCGPLEAADVKPVPLPAACGQLLADWRTWAVCVGIMLAVGLTIGGLGQLGFTLNPGAVGAGGGVLIAFFLSAKAARLRQCGRCGAPS